jgi:hypothetical protein
LNFPHSYIFAHADIDYPSAYQRHGQRSSHRHGPPPWGCSRGSSPSTPTRFKHWIWLHLGPFGLVLTPQQAQLQPRVCNTVHPVQSLPMQVCRRVSPRLSLLNASL